MKDLYKRVVKVIKPGAGSYLLTCIFFFLMISWSPIWGQPYNFQWVLKAGNITSDQGIAIAADPTGNNWVLGRFYGQPVFGDTAMMCGEEMNSFLVMHDTNGQRKWVRYMKVNYVYDLDVNSSGDCLITGTFSNSANLCDTILISDGFRNTFIAKFNGGGNLVWARKTAGPDVEANGITLDEDGGFWLTGAFNDSAAFADSILVSSGSEDIFVARYNAQAELVWLKRAGGQYPDAGRSLAHDKGGNILVTGYFKDISDFGDTTVTAPNAEDVFTAKYNQDGAVLWVRSASGPYVDWPWGISTTATGDCYITGSFEDSLTLGNTVLHAPAASGDIFIAGYSSDGELLWARRAGGDGWDEALAVSAIKNGGCIITGLFGAPAVFGDTTIINASTSWDIFIAQYNAKGEVDWVQQIFGPERDWGQGVAADSTGSAYVTGFFEGPGTFGERILTGFGGSDIFIAKLVPGQALSISSESPALQFYHLSQNYPNPFNPITKIQFQIPSSQFVTLKIYNILGEEVATLVNNKLKAGNHTYRFDGSHLASGVYLYRIEAGEYQQVRKMVLIK